MLSERNLKLNRAQAEVVLQEKRITQVKRKQQTGFYVYNSDQSEAETRLQGVC